MAWLRPDLPRELSWAGLRQDPWRFALALLAITLGVTLGHAILLINDHASAEFARAARDLSGEAHLIVRGPRLGFDETLFPRLALLEEVEGLSPALELEVKRAGSDDTVRLIALDVFRAARVQPALVPVPAKEDDSLAVLRAGNVFVNARAQARWSLPVGGTLAVQVGLAAHDLRVAGTLPSGTDTPLLVMDLGAAQRLFDRLGLINRIDLKLRSDADAARALEHITTLLPPGVQVRTAEQDDATARNATRAYRVNLAVLALVALFTGALLVHATQSLSVARRAAQHALWRALGVTRAQLRNMLLLEAACIGLAGAALGVLSGEVIARVMLDWMSAQAIVPASTGGNAARTAQAFASSHGPLRFSPAPALLSIAGGALAALLGTWTAAARAARMPVAQALKPADAWQWEQARGVSRAGVVTLCAGALLCLAPPVKGLPVFGYLAIAALLLGTLALLPLLARTLLRTIPAAASLWLSLPAAQLRAAMPQVALSLGATVAAVSLSAAMAIMVTSFRDSLDRWLDRVLPAAFYVRAGQPNDSTFIDAAAQASMKALPGIGRVQFQRSLQIPLAPGQPRVTLLARDMGDMAPADFLPLVGAPLAPPPAAADALWVSEIAAALHGLKTGDRVVLHGFKVGGHIAPRDLKSDNDDASPGGPTGNSAATPDLTTGNRIASPGADQQMAFVVAGLWRDYARQQGALLMDRARYLALTGDRRINEAAVWLRPGADAFAVEQALRALAGPQALEVFSAQELRVTSLSIFDRTFAITFALESVAIIIGLVGLSSGVGALVLSRRREFGVLRHLGFTAGALRRLLAVEGLLTTGTGIAAGALLGAAMSGILIHVVNRQSFHWSMDLKVPWGGLCLFAFSLLVMATLTSWWSARKALGTDLVRAVKQDW